MRLLRPGQLALDDPMYPCGHQQLWPATDIPMHRRQPGTYAFDCVQCRPITRHYLMIEVCFDGVFAGDWDHARSKPLKRGAEVVTGRRLKPKASPRPKAGGMAVNPEHVALVRTAFARGAAGYVGGETVTTVGVKPKSKVAKAAAVTVRPRAISSSR